jgi:hypothetical protein
MPFGGRLVRGESGKKAKKAKRERSTSSLSQCLCFGRGANRCENKQAGRARVDSFLHTKERNVQSLTTFSLSGAGRG